MKPDGSSEWKIWRWRREAENLPTWHETPYRSIVPKGAENVLVAGRAAANALKKGLKAAEAYSG